MSRLRVFLVLVALVPMGRAAHAQPVDPYNPPAPAPRPTAPAPTSGPAAPAPAAPSAPARGPAAPARGPAAPAPAAESPQDPYAAPPGQDPVLAERVAEALVARAQQLLDGRVFLDAKQLAVEALVRSPRGAAAERAREIIRAANQGLGIPEDAPRSEPAPPAPLPPLPSPTGPTRPTSPSEDVDTSPIQDPTLSPAPVTVPAEGRPPSTRIAATVHGGLYAGLLGATLGSLFSSDTPAAGAVPLGIAAGIAGGVVAPMLAGRLGWTEAQVRTVGTATVWGGVIGGLFGDIGDLDHTTARQVLLAATVGSTVAGLGGYALARDNRLTRGDIALIDTLAGIGGAGGLTLGMLMQPAHTEGYSLNAVVGIAGGVVAGYVAAPMTNTTPRRMLRVAGLAAVGGAAPFLLYAAIHSSTTSADERITGILSTGGLIAGAWLGFRLTRGMDEGLDTLDGKPRKDVDDAPVALVGRTSSGRWGLGGLGITPLSPALAPQHGLALQLVGAAF